MNTVGIVAEYNPFHRGHAYHLAETRRLLGGESAVVAVMTGDFVQRGSPAAYSKFARAEAACRCGVDLVLELPLPWCLASAEGFARGAVGILDALGQCTHLSFGSECGDLELIKNTAMALADPAMNAAVKDELGGGISYAAARQEALRKRAPELAAVLDTPNNILAVEYVKAIYQDGAHLEPVTVGRVGAGHDETGSGGPKSASEIRHGMAEGADMTDYMPAAAARVFTREETIGRGFMSPEMLETAVVSRLRMLPAEAFGRLPDAGGGVGDALYKAVREEPGLDSIAAAAKSRGCAMSRIRRMIMCAALGVTSGMTDGVPPYTRVLAVNGRGREILRAAAGTTDIPIVTKPADVRALSPRCAGLFALGADAHDLYVLGRRASEERRGGADWRTGPCIVQSD